MQKLMFNDRYGLTMAVLDGTKTQKRCLSAGKPKFKVGQRIAVAQPYKDIIHHILMLDDYETDIAVMVYKKSPGWGNKMFVRSELMPVTIAITDVKSEHIQDISDDDCLKEGVVSYNGGYGFADGKSSDGMRGPYGTPKEAFEQLIRKVSGNKAWDENPLVDVYSFQVE